MTFNFVKKTFFNDFLVEKTGARLIFGFFLYSGLFGTTHHCKNIYRFMEAVPQLKRLDAGFPPRRPGFASGQHVEFVVDKAALGRFSPSTSVSPANYSTDFSIIIITRGWHNRPLVAAVSSGPWIPPPTIQIKKKKL
jgi:hypothetical protein